MLEQGGHRLEDSDRDRVAAFVDQLAKLGLVARSSPEAGEIL